MASTVVAGLVAVGPPAEAQSSGTYQRQPLGLGGAQPNGYSTGYAASADGAMVVLNSYADNLVPNDTNSLPDAFVWNRRTGTVVRQPLGVNGEQPNGRSLGSAISADGTKVTVVSEADNLVPNWPFTNTGDESEFAYVWDLVTGTMTPQPVNSTTCRSPGAITFPSSITADGSTVALTGADCSRPPGDTSPRRSVNLWNPSSGAVTPQAPGVGGAEPNGTSEGPVLSSDGTKVAMMSNASNLVPGGTASAPDLNGVPDAYVWNRTRASYERQPLGVNASQPDGSSRPAAISKDNSKVLLTSYAANLVPGDSNGQRDAYIWNRWNGAYQRQPRGVDGREPNAGSLALGMSADGNRVLIESSATNLVAGTSTGRTDLYVWDRTSGTYTRQPNGLQGALPSGPSSGGAISADGTQVTMSSYASNLVPGDTNGDQDAFVWNLAAAPPTAYRRQPPGVGGAQPDGRTVVDDVSADGAQLLLTSNATNLVAGDGDGFPGVFVWNRLTNSVVRQPLGVGGAQPDMPSSGAAVSPDGTKVSFASQASNLVPDWPFPELVGESTFSYVWDLSTGSVTAQPQKGNDCALLPPLPKNSRPGNFSSDGSTLVITSDDCTLTPGDTNGLADVYLWSWRTGSVVRQPLGATGTQPNGESFDPVLSSDGSKVAFWSEASNLVAGTTSNAPDTNLRPDVYVWNRTTARYERQPLGVDGAQPDGTSTPAAISGDNSKVLLTTTAGNLLPGDSNGQPDVVIWNRWTGTYQRQPLGLGGAQPNGASEAVDISADGAKILLVSWASNLVAGDANGVADVFVWDRSTGRYERQVPGVAGAQPNGASSAGGMSADGRVVGLSSSATNLVPGDTNRLDDAFVWSR